MVSIGSMSIPRSRLGILLDTMIVLNNEYPSSDFNKTQFTESLGLSPKSSGPDHKISDMILFGLLTKGEKGQQIAITNLGKKIINTTGIERTSAIEEAVKKIPLWEKLLNSIGEDTENENFTVTVKTLTGLDDDEIQEKISGLKFAYKEDIGCIKRSPPYSVWTRNTNKPKKTRATDNNKFNNSNRGETQTQKMADGIQFQPVRGYRITSDYAGFQIEVKDSNTYSVALQMLNSIKNELEKQGVKFENKPHEG
jgi:hypothetical protein